MDIISARQSMLCNAVEKYVNVQAELQTHLKWLANEKCVSICAKTENKKFRVGDLSFKFKDTNSIDKNAIVKIVAISTSIYEFNLDRALNGRSGCYDLVNLNIYFMQDPEEIKRRKIKLTDKEKSVLNRMQHIYHHHPLDNNCNEIRNLERDLWGLKNDISVTAECNWSFYLEDLLRDDFMKLGLKCGNIRDLCSYDFQSKL